MEASVCILVVEDEEVLGLTIKESLQHGGYAVELVSSAPNAFSALEQEDAAFAGLITDIHLGSGPSGWDIARRARELSPTLPVVYMSGDSGHEHASKGVPDSLMIDKPFANAQIVTAISSLLVGGN